MDRSQIWSAVQDELRFQLAKPSYETWVKNTTLVSVDGTTFQIGVPSKLAKDWLEDRYIGLIQETLQAVTGSEVQVDVNFTVNQNSPHTPPIIHRTEQPSLKPISEAGPRTSEDFNEKFTFGGFVVGNNSRFAHAAAKAVAETPGETYNPLFLYGGVGLGKTHLMHAIGHAVRERYPAKQVVYMTSEHFINEVITSIQTARMSDFRHKYRTVDVLLIDDVQFLAGKDRTKEEFFHTFNALHEVNKQIVISSDRAPREIPALEDRLRSRFEQGLLADIQPPDFETRLAILKSKLGNNESLISESVLSFMAHKVQKNIRELEGALTRLIAYTMINQRQIDDEEAAELLRDIIPSSSHRPLTVNRIQALVAEYFDITVEEMKSKRRDKQIVFPRQVAMYIVREETPSSLPTIGQSFGGRDHTTALHSIEKIALGLKEDEVLQGHVRNIRERLYQNR
ncbi:MAG: chromosomal replication initiator protein DnaA [Candidatus Dormibacteraceae bacterium]